MSDVLTAKMEGLYLNQIGKLPPGKLGRTLEVVSNTYKTEIDKNLSFFLYSVHIVAEFDRRDGETKKKEITKRTKDDFLEQERKKIATLVFKQICEDNTLPLACAYDRAAQLISLVKIKKADEGEWVITLKKDQSLLFKEQSVMEADRLVVTIKKASDTYQVASSDLHRQNPEVLQALMGVVSIGTSQNIFRDYNKYIVYKSGIYLFDPSSLKLPEIDSGTMEKYIGHGMAKGVDVVDAGGRAIALTIDPRKSAFHYDYMPLSDKMTEMGIQGHNQSLNRYLKRLSVIIHYKGIYKKGDKMRNVQIEGFGCAVRDVIFDVDGRRVKLADYVYEKYKTKLTDLSLPCVITRAGTFSPETLLIAPNQRVRVDQMQKAVQEVIIKASASKPSVRKAEIDKLRGTIDTPKELGMTVAEQPMKVPARVLASPAIETGMGQVRAKNGTWLVKQFVRGAVCQNWSLAILRSQNDRVQLKTAADAIMRKATELGMDLGYPKLMEINQIRGREDAQTMEAVKKAKDAGSNFIMFITFSKIPNHDALKKAELEFGILTQQLKSETAGVLHMKAATLSNVLKKTNEKLGGINYSVTSANIPSWLLSDKTLICGFTMDHPRSQMMDEIEKKGQPDRAAIISWGINAVKGGKGQTEATHFSGGYTYAYPRESQLLPSQETTKKAAIRRIIESFKTCRGTMPANVLLIRRVNEGDSKVVLSEVEEWKAVFTSMGVTPKFVVVTANLNHASRVFKPIIDKDARPMDQNLEAGLTVDSGITSPSLNEFLQQAHVPRQGTARPTKYNLLYVDEGLKVTMDDIEMSMYALCHTHAVCDMTTALPTPLKISEEFCKRALNLFHYSVKRDWNVDQLNQDLVVQQNSPLDSLRFNA